MPVPGFWLATSFKLSTIQLSIFSVGIEMKGHLVLLLVAGLGLASSSRAADGIAIEGGWGDDSTTMAQISLTRQWDRKWFTDGNWYLSGYWEASVGHWHSTDAGGKGIWDVGFAPVFRFQPKSGGVKPYVEGAIGFHLISDTHVNADRDLGSAFQFGDHLGVGLVFGDKGRFDLGYRFQHLSNADIKSPNDGIDFQQIRFAYYF